MSLAVLACAGGAAAPAGARVTRWHVTASLTASYANSVTAAGNALCPAHYAEKVRGLRVMLTSTRPIAYDPVAHSFTGPLRYRLSGRWSVTGAYTAQVGQPDGTLGCAAAPTPVACSAKVVFEDGHRTSTTGRARMSVDGTGRHTILSRITAPRLTEQYADAGSPPPSWPDVCTLSPDDETLPATPLFGLSTTELLDRALAARLSLPTSKLRGHRRFTVRGATARPRGCPAQGFDPCDESGSAHLAVTFRPM